MSLVTGTDGIKKDMIQKGYCRSVNVDFLEIVNTTEFNVLHHIPPLALFAPELDLTCVAPTAKLADQESAIMGMFSWFSKVRFSLLFRQNHKK